MKTMHKFCITFLTVICFGVTFNANAAPSLNSVQATKHSEKALKSSTPAYRTQTDVHVVNHSNAPITVKVPGTTIYDTLRPYEKEDFTSPDYFDALEIVLYDEEGIEFFRDYVPNHATVEVTETSRKTLSAGNKSKLKATINK